VSWRVEQADALALLRELPDGWAQACVTRPPRSTDPDRTLAILTETRRVLRGDGTLWAFLEPETLLLATELQAEGWTQQSSPTWATRRSVFEGGVSARVFLFSKQDRHYYDPRTIGARPSPPGALCANQRARHAHTCVHAREREHRLRLVKQCVLAGSSPLACGGCGAPYRRIRPGESATALRRPTCAHHNPCGRCLLLDPFYDPAGLPTAEAALCTGRSFLGITAPEQD
jgi:hypothetical protein